MLPFVTLAFASFVLPCDSVTIPQPKIVSPYLTRTIQYKSQKLSDVRIIGGEEANVSDYPFTVSLQYNGTFFGHDVEHFCAGSILNERWIVTTAQCSTVKGAGPLYVRAGTNYYYKNGQVYTVEKIVIHPNFNDVTFDYAVALLKVSRKIMFSDNTKPIQLPQKNSTLQDGKDFEVVGWGTEKLLGPVSDELRKTRVTKIDNEDCANLYGAGLVNERAFCAFFQGTGPCVGDSGSPAALDGILVGMASFSYSCAYIPSGYVDMAEFVDWILNVIQTDK